MTYIKIVFNSNSKKKGLFLFLGLELCKELLVEIDQENCEFNWALMF